MKKISNSEFVVMDLLWKEGRSLNRHEIAELILKTNHGNCPLSLLSFQDSAVKVS